MQQRHSHSARLCWALERHSRLLLAGKVLAAAFFVLGCLAFYSSALYTLGVSLFLAGSVLMLLNAAADAFLRYGPSE